MDATSRVCKRCRVARELVEFRENRNVCKVCERRRTKTLSTGPEGFFRYVLRSSKSNAKVRGLDHHLTIDDLRLLYSNQDGRCAVTRLPLTTEIADQKSDGRKHTNLSLDRINVRLGYTFENTVLVCQAVNLMRQQLSYGDLRFWCELILEGNDPSTDESKERE